MCEKVLPLRIAAKPVVQHLVFLFGFLPPRPFERKRAGWVVIKHVHEREQQIE